MSLGKFALIGILAVSFSDRITLGSVLVGLVLGVLGLVSIIGGGRRWREMYELEKEKYTISEGENRDLTMQRLELTQRIHQLEERPDQAAVLQMMGELAVKEDAAGARRVESVERTVREEFTKHEDRAQERHEETVKVLQEIASTLRNPGENSSERPTL